MKTVILGTAHLSTTAGKCSPDKKFREYRYSREIVTAVYERLKEKGCRVLIDYYPDEPPAYVLSKSQNTMQSRELSMRVKIVNDHCAKHGTADCCYVSIHVNAAGGDGKWHNAGGWCAYTSKGQTKADRLAECLYDAAKTHLSGYAKRLEEGKKSGAYSKAQTAIRTETKDGDRDIESNFYVLAKTKCAAVLTENMFQDTKADVEFLTSEEGKEAIIRLHVDGILKYISAK
ncbi:MAG: N-acetylmuramoyl-L-alanine amidase [Bacteroidaceae bacterium]|nr:N-acetylmuramoyl-L-alanine amidase [Bacteroidaceae bacterium]